MTPLVKELLVRALDDWLCVFELPYLVRRLDGPVSNVQQRERSLEAVKQLLEGGLWIAGGLVGSAFEPWGLGPEAALTRIEREWPIGWLPDYNDICWFASTELGSACAKDLVRAGFKTIDDDD